MVNSHLQQLCLVSVNDLSQVIGSLQFIDKRLGNSTSRGFFWNANEFESFADLGPCFINDLGDIVFSRTINKQCCVYMRQNDEVVLIQRNARATAINNNGVVVGDRGRQSFGDDEKAWVYLDGVSYDLFDLVVDISGWKTLNLALDINDSGQIVGYGLRNGKVTGFLLNPL